MLKTAPFLQLYFAKFQINLAECIISPGLGPVLCSCCKRALCLLLRARAFVHQAGPLPWPPSGRFSLGLCASVWPRACRPDEDPLLSKTNLCLALTSGGHCLAPNTSKGSATITRPPRTETFLFFHPTLALPESTCVLLLFIRN